MSGHWLAEVVGDGGDLFTKILAGAAALAGAYSAWRASKRDTDADEMRTLRRENTDLRADVLTLKGVIFSMRAKLAENGIQTSEPPRLRSEDWE